MKSPCKRYHHADDEDEYFRYNEDADVQPKGREQLGKRRDELIEVEKGVLHNVPAREPRDHHTHHENKESKAAQTDEHVTTRLALA